MMRLVFASQNLAIRAGVRAGTQLQYDAQAKVPGHPQSVID